MIDIFDSLLITTVGVLCLHWGGTSLLRGEFKGIYRFTSQKYVYTRKDSPWKYWAETLTITITGIGALILGIWSFFI